MNSLLFLLALGLAALGTEAHCNPKKDPSCCRDLKTKPRQCELWTMISPEQCSKKDFVGKCRASCNAQYPLMGYCLKTAEQESIASLENKIAEQAEKSAEQATQIDAQAKQLAEQATQIEELRVGQQKAEATSSSLKDLREKFVALEEKFSDLRIELVARLHIDPAANSAPEYNIFTMLLACQHGQVCGSCDTSCTYTADGGYISMHESDKCMELEPWMDPDSWEGTDCCVWTNEMVGVSQPIGFDMQLGCYCYDDLGDVC